MLAWRSSNQFTMDSGSRVRCSTPRKTIKILFWLGNPTSSKRNGLSCDIKGGISLCRHVMSVTARVSGFHAEHLQLTSHPASEVIKCEFFGLARGSLVFGAVVGGIFGLARAVAIFLVAGARDPSALRRALRKLQDGLSSARVLVVGAQTAAALTAIVFIVR